MIYKYVVMMSGAACPITIMSSIPNLRSQWQHMRRNDVHEYVDRSGKVSQIVINYLHVVSVVGPNDTFDMINPVPFPYKEHDNA